jgi:hypothetical protein
MSSDIGYTQALVEGTLSTIEIYKENPASIIATWPVMDELCAKVKT